MPSVRHRLAARLVSLQPRATDAVSIEAARLLFEDVARFLPMPEGVTPVECRVDGLAAEWLVPARPRGTMLYLHGGGYCFGSIDSHRGLAARVAAAARCRTLLVDYRLAPEHPFPAAVEDALRAYEWLLAEEDVSPERLLVGGDSSGGGMALSLLLLLARRDRPLPAGAVCLSPWLDLTLGLAASSRARVEDPMISLEDAEVVSRLYVAGADRRDPLVSPLYGNPCGLPPVLVQVGTRELLLEESRRFTESARRVGVEVTLQEWPGLIHVWQFFAPLVPESNQAIEALGAWAAARLEAAPSGEETTDGH
jgi:phosphinothricin tripeptide acetyl hydrolase